MAARQWKSRALGVIGSMAIATGCADDGVSLHTICPIAPELDDTGCTWDSSSELCVAEGVLNVLSADSYRLSLKVESGLRARRRDVPVLGEPNGLQIKQAEVELLYPNGDLIGLGALDNPYRVVASGYVNPMGTTIVAVPILGKAYVDALATSAKTLPQIVASVKLFGETNGTEEVESSDFFWPIRLIEVSPSPLARECSMLEYCQGSLGQDGFAEACSAAGS